MLVPLPQLSFGVFLLSFQPRICLSPSLTLRCLVWCGSEELGNRMPLMCVVVGTIENITIICMALLTPVLGRIQGAAKNELRFFP